MDLVEKTTGQNLSFFLCKDYKKDIFDSMQYGFEPWHKNEILAFARMKSAIADEIFGIASDEIKSTHPLLTADFTPVGDFIVEDDFTHPTGWI